MTFVSFQAEDRQLRKLSELSRKVGISRSELLRQLVESAEVKPVRRVVEGLGVSGSVTFSQDRHATANLRY